jgi:hypothetical protein
MADKREKGPKFAAVIPTGYELDSKGKVRLVTGDIVGDPEAIEATRRLLQDRHGDDISFKSDKEASKSSTWSGVGDVKMDPSRGGRTTQRFVKGIGWTDISVN